MEKNIANIFPKLQHLSLSSNLIGDSSVTVKYKDNIEKKEKRYEKEIYKLRMMYKFIEINKNLTKMNITKNPISEIYTIVPEEKKKPALPTRMFQPESFTCWNRTIPH